MMQQTLSAERTSTQVRFGRIGVMVLVLVLLLALVWTGVQVVRLRPPADPSPAVNFARDMSAHHTQAVDMALIIRDRSTNAELRQFAIDIVLTQQAQIGQMQGWLAVWNHPLSGVQPPMGGNGEMMGMATQDQVDQLRTLPVAQAEVQFLQLMIRHHQGGVAMAEDALKTVDRPEVTRLATAIVQGQTSEITYMQQLLTQRGAQPLPNDMPMNMPMDMNMPMPTDTSMQH